MDFEVLTKFKVTGEVLFEENMNPPKKMVYYFMIAFIVPSIPICVYLKVDLRLMFVMLLLILVTNILLAALMYWEYNKVRKTSVFRIRSTGVEIVYFGQMVYIPFEKIVYAGPIAHGFKIIKDNPYTAANLIIFSSRLTIFCGYSDWGITFRENLYKSGVIFHPSDLFKHRLEEELNSLGLTEVFKC